MSVDDDSMAFLSSFSLEFLNFLKGLFELVIIDLLVECVCTHSLSNHEGEKWRAFHSLREHG